MSDTASGRVSAHLAELLGRQAAAHGLVVWLDPSEEYRAFAAGLAARLPGVAVELLEPGGSLLDLRRRVEPHLSPYQPGGQWRDRPGQVIAYVPLKEEKIGEALVDLTRCGVVVEPGGTTGRNTRLPVLARAALKDVLPPTRVDALARDAEAGTLTLADLDRLAEAGGSLEFPRLDLLYGARPREQILLAFLSDPTRDDDVTANGALEDLIRLVAETFGPQAVGQATTPADLRRALARFVLLSELAGDLGQRLPASLAGVPVASGDAARKTARDLAREWRNRLDLRTAYQRAAEEVAATLHLEHGQFRDVPVAALLRCETFKETELALQCAVEHALVAGDDPGLSPEQAKARAARFWSRGAAEQNVPVIGERWRLVADAARVLALSDTVRRTLQRRTLGAAALIEAYAEGLRGTDATRGPAWYVLDTHHRRMLRRFHEYSLEFDSQPEAAGLRALVARARQRYDTAVADLAEAFADALFSAAFNAPGVLPQTEIFVRVVRPALDDPAKVALLIVDALRFEMAAELAGTLPGWQPELRPALGVFPSITPVGMAALMPGAERGLALVERGARTTPLGVEASGRPAETRAQRMELLKAALPAGALECKLEDLTPPSESMRRRLQTAKTVVVSSQEIDLLGHTDNAAFARQYMDSVLGELRKAIAALGSSDVERVIVVADHGYLFSESAGAGQKIEQPGGETLDLHRRVWIGRGGSAAAGVLRASAAQLGLGGDLELATPRSLAVFEASGGAGYLHGGVSPQELIVPVLELVRIAPAGKARLRAAPQLTWEVVPGSRAGISTRFFSVTLRATTPELLPIEPPRVRVELRLSLPEVHVVTAASADYGLDSATGELDLRVDTQIEGGRTVEPNRVTFHISDDLPVTGTESMATVAVFDAATGRLLHETADIPVKISM